MPPKPKYNYDIKTIESLRNKAQSKGNRLSIREIAKQKNWPRNVQQWINNNFIEVTSYIPK